MTDQEYRPGDRLIRLVSWGELFTRPEFEILDVVMVEPCRPEVGGAVLTCQRYASIFVRVELWTKGERLWKVTGDLDADDLVQGVGLAVLEHKNRICASLEALKTEIGSIAASKTEGTETDDAEAQPG